MADAQEIEKAKDYAAAAGRIAGAVEALLKHDGWEIFMALYKRECDAIRAREDYDTIEAFRGDREAIRIVDGIIETFKGYVEDAEAAAKALEGLSTDEPRSRGIMLIEAAEGGSIEG